MPILMLLFFLGMSADLVAGDVGSGRITFLASLPVRPGAIWAAKVLFLAWAAGAYLAYLFLTEYLILTVAGHAPLAMFESRAAPGLIALAWTPTAGAATLFFSTLVDRGIAAVFAAAAVLPALGLAAWGAGLLAPDVAPAFALHGSAVLSLGFLGGSYAAFTRGRIHLGYRGRRILLATGTLLILSALGAAGFAARIGPRSSHSPTRIESTKGGIHR